MYLRCAQQICLSLLPLNVDNDGKLYMYAKDTNGLIHVRLIKLYDFPMGTICCHGLTFSDVGRLFPIHYSGSGPPKIARPVLTRLRPCQSHLLRLNTLLLRLFFMPQLYQLVVILWQVAVVKND